MRKLSALILTTLMTGGIAFAEKKKADHGPATETAPRYEPPVIVAATCLQMQPAPQPLNPTLFAQARTMPETRVVKVYPVTDLLMTPRIVQAGAFGELLAVKPMEKVYSVEELKEFLTSVVDSTSWKARGGSATLEYYPVGGGLVVSQTPGNHHKVQQALDALRGEEEPQYTHDFHFVTISNDCYRRLVGESDPSSRNPIRVLSDLEQKNLMSAFQQDRQTQVVSSPAILTLNGQTGWYRSGDFSFYTTEFRVANKAGNISIEPKNDLHFSGLKFGLTCTRSSDGRTAKVVIEGEFAEMASEPRQAIFTTTISPEATNLTQTLQLFRHIRRSLDREYQMTEGSTVMYDAGVADIDMTVPVLVKMPYCDRLMFHSMTVTRKNHLMVMVRSSHVKPKAEMVKQAAFATQPSPVADKLDPLDQLAIWMIEYRIASKNGDTEKAKELAVKCLAIDPTCFAAK